jgi:superfamily II DNA or RNA helicase
MPWLFFLPNLSPFKVPALHGHQQVLWLVPMAVRSEPKNGSSGLVPALLKKLFPCQREAISVIDKYLRTPVGPNAALVQMPMGTGKTGLMALCCTSFPKYAKALIVAPAEYLTRQIRTEVTNKFWEHAGLAVPAHLSAQTFTPSTFDANLPSSVDVLVCTVQTLQQLHTSSDQSFYEALRQSMNLVIFDEGHREPALTWAKAIRDLNKKIILFTATPYRNDNRKFSIDPNFKYVFPHREAERENIIRRVDIQLYPKRTSTESFGELLRQQLQRESRRHAEPRILVRCPGANEISTLVHLLNSRRAGSAMGFHSAVPESEFLKRKIPDLDSVPASVRFFVHEKLLIEGVDDKRFSCLAIHGRMNNARELIQQVGRVIRNGSHTPEVATVLAAEGSPYQRWWENYLKAQDNPAQWWYANGEFRESFDPHEAALNEDLSFALSARIFEAPSTLDLSKLVHDVIEELQEHDFTELSSLHDDRHRTTVVMYQLEEQVSFIKNKTYVQSSLGYFVVHLEEDLVFYFDSHGLSPALLDERFSRVPARKLQRLLGGQGSRITYVDLANCDVSRSAVRSRSARAFSVEDALHSLNDHSHYCRTARGLPQNDHAFGRRYVGFGRSRVSDSSKGDWKEFHEWATSVAVLIRRNSKPPRIFTRYAELVTVPPDPIPTSILLDLDDIEDHIINAKKSPVHSIPELCVDVDNWSFSLRIDRDTIPVRITYSDKKKRFLLESPQLHANFKIAGEESLTRSKSLLSYLNQEQSFRLTMTQTDLLYGSGSFFRPRWRLSEIASEAEIPMREVFVPIVDLGAAISEKGSRSRANHSRWEDTCLFGMMDQWTETGRPEFAALPWLVCDDQGHEIADFIGLDPNSHRIVFIHAQSTDGTLSGTFFHKICGQVKKNLDYAHRYSNRTPPNIRQWDGEWHPTGQIFPAGDFIRKRMRRPQRMDGVRFWEESQRLLSNPNSTVEVWMVLGGGFQFDRYVQELCSTTPAPQAVQIAYQLQSTLDAVSQIGAKLKILCRR